MRNNKRSLNSVALAAQQQLTKTRDLAKENNEKHSEKNSHLMEVREDLRRKGGGPVTWKSVFEIHNQQF